MTVAVGEILKNKITEDLHEVKKIEDSIVVLEYKDGLVWISLRKKDLGFYYEKINGGDAKWHL